MPTSSDSMFAPGLRWLIRLRWLALLGWIVLFLAGVGLLRLQLSPRIILPALVVMVVSNIYVARKSEVLPERETCAVLLALDTAILTYLLYWLGGETNPFTAFYLLHITIAAVLLPALWAWIGVVLCGVGYGILFLSPHKLVSLSGVSCCDDHDFHLQGMLLALVLVGVCIAFFVSHLKSVLTRREAELDKARKLAARNEKFAGMATLAAGVAHELATPLGTIAVLSADLAQQTCSQCQNNDINEDAALIRREVQRCRGILEKLGDDATQQVGENIKAFELQEFGEQFREFLSPAYFKRVDIHLPIEPAILWIPSTTWMQAVAVMVKNACEASDEGLRVNLEISIREGRLITNVTDRGQGMTPDVAQRAGEPFFTTKKTGQGMGLGLFLVRMFAERTKGEVTIHSVPGEGSVVTLDFPLELESEER